MTFEETYKTAYSHGLEAIYALENVDVKSIRPIHTPQNPPPKKVFIEHIIEKQPDQYEFDFGDSYRGWIDAFIKQEPIHVLSLSRHAEKCLIDHGKKVLDDLIHANLREFVFLKGMGQGHVDEIQQKLNNYLEGRPLTRCTKIDFASWIRSIAAAFDRKKVYTLMEKYNLSDLFSLSPAESVEARRLTLEKKGDWIQEMRIQLQEPMLRETVREQIRKVVNVFIKPWMKRRHGFATQEELEERIERLSINPVEAKLAMAFISDIYFDNGFPFKEYLLTIDKKIYCINSIVHADYCDVVKKASSYFYKPQTAYPLAKLVEYLEKEFSLSWEGFPEGYLNKVLRITPSFSVRKGQLGCLEIHTI